MREPVHAEAGENPGFGAPPREPVHGMVLYRVDDPAVYGYDRTRLWVENVEPLSWITEDVVAEIISAQDLARALGVTPKVEIEFVAGAMLSLTIRAENGTWIWRFGEFDGQRRLYRLAWPD